MARSLMLRVLLLLVLAACGYRWLGLYVVVIGLVAFMLYELLTPPRRYRTFGPDQMQEAVDNRFGIFGRFYREDGLTLNSRGKSAE
jgi:hypothetical protein